MLKDPKVCVCVKCAFSDSLSSGRVVSIAFGNGVEFMSFQLRCPFPAGMAASLALWHSGVFTLFGQGDLPSGLCWDIPWILTNVGAAAFSAFRMWCCHAAFGVAQGTRFVTGGEDEQFVLVWQTGFSSLCAAWERTCRHGS